MSYHVTSCHRTHVYHRFKERKSRNEINSIIVTSVVVTLHSVKHVYMNGGRQAGGYVCMLTSILSITLLNQRTHTHTNTFENRYNRIMTHTRTLTHRHTHIQTEIEQLLSFRCRTLEPTHTHTRKRTLVQYFLEHKILYLTRTHTHMSPHQPSPSPLLPSPHPTPHTAITLT